MTIGTIAKTELLRIWRNKMTRIAMLAAIIIPLLYAGLYLWANWDPYGKVDKVPVAVVNLDSGGTQDQKPVNYGQNFIDTLKNDHTMEWHFVDEKTAKSGLEGKQFFLMVTVPRDFTQDVLSVTGDHPKQAGLLFTSNQGKNYLVTSISKRVETELVKNLGNSISEQYVSRLLDVVGKASNGLSNASHAASQLASGASSLQQGSSDLASGIGNAVDGNSSLLAGSTRITSGLQSLSRTLGQTSSGNDQVAKGLTQVNSGLISIHDKMTPLAGPGSQLATGIQQASDASSQLLQANTKTTDGVKQTATGIQQIQSNLQQIQQGVVQTNQLVQNSLTTANLLIQQNSGLASNPQMQQLIKNLQVMQQSGPSIHDGLGQIETGIGSTSTSLQSILSGQQQISGGLSQLSGQLQQAGSGVTQFTGSIGKLQTGLDQLGQGVTAAQQNVSKIASAEHQLQQGATQLHNGSTQLGVGLTAMQNGLEATQTGANKLHDGASQLANGANELSGKLKDSTKQGMVPSAKNTAGTMANPVTQLDQPIHNVDTYGTGLAPYFFSLSYWVGAFMLYFLIKMRDPRWFTMPVSKPSIILGKFLALAPISILQAVVSSFVIEKALHLDPMNQIGYYTFNILLSLAFTAIVGLFIVLLGTGPGRFLTIVILILQLTSAGGTFPIEMVPTLFQSLHPFLPMTYSVDALRQILSIGDWHTAWQDATIIASYGIVALLIASIFSRGRIRMRDLAAEDTLVP